MSESRICGSLRREHRLRHGPPAVAPGCHGGGDDALPQRLPETLRPRGGFGLLALASVSLWRGLPLGALGGGAGRAPGGRLPPAGRVDQQCGADGAEAHGALRAAGGSREGALGGSAHSLPQATHAEPEVHGGRLGLDLRPELLEFNGA